MKKLLTFFLLLTSSLMAATPTGYWKLDERAGVVTNAAAVGASSLDANSSPAVIRGITGPVGYYRALQSTNSASYVATDTLGGTLQTDPALQAPAGLTVAFWIYPTTTFSGTSAYAMSKGVNTSFPGSVHNYGVAFVTNQVQFSFGNGTQRLIGNTSTNWNSLTGAWHHVAVTVNPTNSLGLADFGFYLDGALLSTNNNALVSGTLGVGLNIGTNNSPVVALNSPSGLSGFVGGLDELRIYTNTITGSDILALASVPGSVTTTNQYWLGTGSRIYDGSGVRYYPNNQTSTYVSNITDWLNADTSGSISVSKLPASVTNVTANAITNGSNLGTGVGIFRSVSGNVANFNSITGGTHFATTLIGSNLTLSIAAASPLTALGLNNGSALTNLNASSLASGTIPTARYGAEVILTNNLIGATNSLVPTSDAAYLAAFTNGAANVPWLTFSVAGRTFSISTNATKIALATFSDLNAGSLTNFPAGLTNTFVGSTITNGLAATASLGSMAYQNSNAVAISGGTIYISNFVNTAARTLSVTVLGEQTILDWANDQLKIPNVGGSRLRYDWLNGVFYKSDGTTATLDQQLLYLKGGNWSMQTNKLMDLSAPTLANDAVRLVDLQVATNSLPFIAQSNGTGTNTTLFGVTIGSNALFNGGATFTNGVTISSPIAGSLAYLQIVENSGTNGVEGVFLDSYNNNSGNGSVYIGRRAGGTLASPSAVSNDYTLVAIVGRGYGATGFSPLSRGALTVRAAETWSDTAQGTKMLFFTTLIGTSNAVERARFTDAGRLGIGTNAPAALLHVNGTSQFDGALTANAAATFTNGITISGPIGGSLAYLQIIENSGTNAISGLFVDSYNNTPVNGGNLVGRRAGGTFAAPTAVSNDYALAVLSGRGYGATGFSPVGKGVISIRAAETWNDGSNGTKIVFLTTAIGSSNQTERLRLTDIGSLGIGTNAPAALLHVAGTAIVEGAFTANSLASFTNGVVIGGTTSTNALLYLIANSGSANAEGVFGDNYNNVANTGFGFVGRRARGTLASPTSVSNSDTLAFLSGRGYTGTTFSSPSKATLSLRASENWNDGSNGTAMIFVTTANGGTNNTEKMQLTGDGRLGIGTNSPAATLHVNGNAIIDTNLTVNGGFKGVMTFVRSAIQDTPGAAYATLTNMSLAVGPGTNLVTFSASWSATANNSELQVGVFDSGALVAGSDRTSFISGNSRDGEVSLHDVITTTSNTTLTIQSKLVSGSMTVSNKSFTVDRR